jgi:1-deoxy-D-xylulose-5-phosphate synthase
VSILEKIHDPQDLKNLNMPQLKQLAGEMREFIVESVSKTGGHLASNLGTVELAIALHKVFESPKDKLIWDVGHQAYPHKILTGRWERFHTLRQYQGISGFLRPQESVHDAFAAGHSSTSISAGLGFALARDYQKEDYKVVSIIGDGALTAGMALEALNHAGHCKTDLLMVLNDNKMSISPNVGALSNYLNSLITGEFYNQWKARVEDIMSNIPRYGKRIRSLVNRFEEGLKGIIVPGILFEEMGIRYFGPIDGHDLSQMIDVFERTRGLKMPRIIHIITTKGKGYKLAEKNPSKWHGASKFDKVTGQAMTKPSPGGKKVLSYHEVLGKVACKLAEEDSKVAAITAAMCTGTGLTEFSETYPSRFYDVGIAEQHAVTMAAGLAMGGLKPIVSIYSTFLQRAYDQIIHDVCLQDIPMILAVDRAGIVGADGATHQGLFDISFLRHMPNIVLMAPTNEEEMHQMFRTALKSQHPCAIRYPRGKAAGVPLQLDRVEPVPLGKARVVQEGTDVALIVYGTILHDVMKTLPMLEEEGIHPTVVNARFAKPIDEELMISLLKKGYRLVTIEEHVLAGGFGSRVLEVLEEHRLPQEQVLRLGVPDHFVEHGDREVLMEVLGLSPRRMTERIVEFCRHAHSPSGYYTHSK